MGCAQSKDGDENKLVASSGSSGMNQQQIEIKGIGRTERMIHRGGQQKRGEAASRPSNHSGMSNTTSESSGKYSKSELKNQLKMSIRDRNKGSFKGPELDPITGNLAPSEVARRRERAIKVNSTKVLNDGSVTVEYAYCTQRGYYPDGE
jgi:hypothetical protein